MQGRIKWYSATKGYGFIRNDESDEDFFFHSSELNYGFVPINGALVEFEPKDSSRGLKAVNIRAVVVSKEEDND